MIDFSQGDIIKIEGYNIKFLIVSRNSFVKATGMFHVCPIMKETAPGPIHIEITGKKGEAGTVICEEIKLIDPDERACSLIDSIHYSNMMDISDAIQGVFEYD